MTIGLDGNEANEDFRFGVHQYAYKVLWGMYKLRQESYTEANFEIFLKRPPKNDLPPENDFWKYRVIEGERLWIIKKLVPALWKSKNLDVFFTPTHYLPPVIKIPSVCSIMDLGYLEFSEQFKKYDFWQLKYWTAISIIISKYIICISESTMRDVVRHYPFAYKKAKVVYLGYDSGKYNTKISQNLVRLTKDKYNIKGDYFLFLGTLKPSKNIDGIINAFSEISNKNYKIYLVMAGNKGWMYESVFEKVKKLKLTDRVVFTGYVDEEDKPALIRGARAFLMPSFWEGFGLDALTSIACGVPAVVSDVASIPEVTGDAAIYVNPNISHSIAVGMQKVLNLTQTEKRRLVQKGLKQAKKFSWEYTARNVLDILLNVKR